MRLIVEALIGSIIASVALVLLAFAATWPIDATARIDAVVLMLWWIYVFIGHWFVTHNHILGQAELRRMIRWITPDDATTPPDESPAQRPLAQLDAPHQQVIEQVDVTRIMPVNKAPAPAEIELPNGKRVSRADLVYFVDHLDHRGHTRGSWDGVVMPSSKKVDGPYHKLLMDAVAESGEFPVRGQGIKSKRILSTAEIKRKLNL